MSAAPKCKNCATTAYQQESITYDGNTYHKRCFRCIKCDSVVSLGKVAMIQGDLYCKNCFLRMFSEKGTYHVFGAKTLPKSMKKGTDSPRAESDATPTEQRATSPALSEPRPTSPSVVSDPSGATLDGAKTRPRINLTVPARDSPTSNTSTSPTNADQPSPRKQIKICVIDDCIKPRVVGKNWCEDHLKQKLQENAAPPAGVDALFAAIRAKSVSEVREVLHQYGVQICLVPVDRKSAIQFAFSDEGSSACGEIIIETLADHLKDLQADVDMLKDSMTNDEEKSNKEANK